MDTTTLMLIHAMCIIGVYMYDKRVDVTDRTCGHTYNIGMYKSINILVAYNPDNKLASDSLSNCTLTFVNNDPFSETCIKTPTSYWDTSSCDLTFKYFLGKVPSYSKWDGHRCHKFRHRPLCTTVRRVFAVYKVEYPSIFLSSFEVIIYKKKILVTTTRRTTTTTDWNSNDYEGSYSTVSSTTGSICMVFIGVAIVGILVYLCCKMSSASSANAPESPAPVECTQESSPPLQDHTPESHDQTSRSHDQTSRSHDQTSRHQAYTEDAPAYSSLIYLQLQEPSQVDDNDNNWRMNDLELDDDESTSSEDSLSVPNDQPSPIVLFGSSSTIDADDSIPSVPPPAYADIEPPPPYPGY